MNLQNQAPLGDTSSVNWAPWIQTYSGHKFHFLNDDSQEVYPLDIAVVLSRMPRWAGHTREFYSVAQHSIAVAMLVRERGGNISEQLQALLHDGTEAYMCDMPSPLKRMIPQFKEIEALVWAKISKRFFGDVREMTPLIHDCDLTMLATEARDLLTADPIDNWTQVCPTPHAAVIVPIESKEAENKFLDTLLSLSA